LKLWLYFIGKPKDAHANALAAEYVKRASKYAPVEMAEIRPDRGDLFARHPSATKILLDPVGKTLDSNGFAAIFSDAAMRGHDLVFAVGGHDGFPPGWRERANLLLSLSAMTLPHELARAVLAEQIYRAFTIMRGHPYPR
jgi:23S rRNA (pseudouridine1915-N3)-methyltransferase